MRAIEPAPCFFFSVAVFTKQAHVARHGDIGKAFDDVKAGFLQAQADVSSDGSEFCLIPPSAAVKAFKAEWDRMIGEALQGRSLVSDRWACLGEQPTK